VRISVPMRGVSSTVVNAMVLSGWMAPAAIIIYEQQC
jgi:hypothetical protein